MPTQSPATSAEEAPAKKWRMVSDVEIELKPRVAERAAELTIIAPDKKPVSMGEVVRLAVIEYLERKAA